MCKNEQEVLGNFLDELSHEVGDTSEIIYLIVSMSW